MLFSYDNFITSEKLLWATTCQKKEKDGSDVLSSPSFLSPVSKPGPV